MLDSLYIHVPFCLKKCDYCDFISFPVSACNLVRNERDDNMIKQYVEYLKRELLLYPSYEYSTIYFGGGTPSLLSISELESILELLRIKDNCEITIEVNPKSVDYNKLSDFKKIGINRLSIGCQSFDETILKILGRVHSSKEAIATYSDARKAGFDNINLDLIFSVPSQTKSILENDLKIITELEPEHIAIYSLIWEENTPLYEKLLKKELVETDNDIEADFFEEIISFLKKKGYEHYEISNFAKKGFESKHNKKYWKNSEYLGIGLNSAGYINDMRYKNFSSFEEYYNSIKRGIFPYEEREIVDKQNFVKYQIILGLRLLNEGIDIKVLKENDDYIKIAEELIVDSLLEKREERFVLTKKGLFLANEVFMRFL